MAVYGYCRVSSQTQADEGESLGVQERQIQGWCLMQGETLTNTFVERGVSGSMPVAKRPMGELLMAGVKAGDTIVTARLDRLFRSALDALQTVEAMRKRKVRVVVIDSLGDITGNGLAKAFLTIASAFAELERDSVRDRVSTVKADQRGRGRYLGGKVPLGYKVTGKGREAELVEDPAEQAIIASIVKLKGHALRSIRTVIAAKHNRTISLDAISRVLRENRVAV